jgi:hypothetical protein
VKHSSLFRADETRKFYDDVNSSVFGVSGKNSVKVETANYNYNYQIEK